MKKNLVLIFLIAFSLIFVGTARAASKYTLLLNRNFKGQEVMSVWISSPDRAVNTISGKLSFEQDINSADITDAGSVVRVWLEKPTLSGMEISFSGIIPGGYRGEAGKVFEVVVTSSALRHGRVSGEFYENNGQGTKIEVPDVKFDFTNAGENLNEQIDTIPPQAFMPVLGKDEHLFDGKWFVSFMTQDKESGIDHYEKREAKLRFFRERWERSESPQLLKDQSLSSYVYIKAVDKKGNGKIEILRPENGIYRYDFYIGWGILFILLCSMGYILWLKRA
jgi:hypothetical protein